jgi:uncharacterized membrane protein YkoI
LLPQAKITVEQAITEAQTQLAGSLGTLELEHRNGALVFEVTIGDQEVFVDATTGQTVAVQPVAQQYSDASGCEQDSPDTALGTLEDGKDLLSQATITVDQAATIAQAVAPGQLGAIDLEREHGSLEYHVTVGDQEVTIDATTGAVLGINRDDAE